MGRTPLFLLDGELSEKTLRRAVEKLGLTAFVAIYRPYDVKLKIRYEGTCTRVRSIDYMRKDGEMADWVKDDIHRYKTTNDDFVRDALAGLLHPVFEFESARADYNAAVATPPIDAITGERVAGDLNEYLYRRASGMYPLGVESVLESNIKQSMIPKSQSFRDGLEGAPAPKGVRKIDEGGA